MRGQRWSLDGGLRDDSLFFLFGVASRAEAAIQPLVAGRTSIVIRSTGQSKYAVIGRELEWSDIIDVVRDSSPFSVSVFLPTGEQRTMIVHTNGGGWLAPETRGQSRG